MRFDLQTKRREEAVDVTSLVQQAVAEAKLEQGAALVYCPHTTAGLTVNENADPDVMRDVLAGLARVVPRQAGWRHAEGNSDAHIKSSLVGVSLLVPVEAGRLALGTWQAIYFCEFDGPRSRRLTVRLLAGA